MENVEIKKFKMIVKCAWCDALLRTVDANRPNLISHGICEVCKRKILLEAGVYVDKLQVLSQPVKSIDEGAFYV